MVSKIPIKCFLGKQLMNVNRWMFFSATDVVTTGPEPSYTAQFYCTCGNISWIERRRAGERTGRISGRALGKANGVNGEDAREGLVDTKGERVAGLVPKMHH